MRPSACVQMLMWCWQRCSSKVLLPSSTQALLCWRTIISFGMQSVATSKSSTTFPRPSSSTLPLFLELWLATLRFWTWLTTPCGQMRTSPRIAWHDDFSSRSCCCQVGSFASPSTRNLQKTGSRAKSTCSLSVARSCAYLNIPIATYFMDLMNWKTVSMTSFPWGSNQAAGMSSPSFRRRRVKGSLTNPDTPSMVLVMRQFITYLLN
mmetsp:Transcript_49666/g.118287  ORF Transcript_49666/g.118287 Transcript_49666/m.118287 type:complete len:207 (-) Transcript_49666:181-801(-)